MVVLILFLMHLTDGNLRLNKPEAIEVKKQGAIATLSNFGESFIVDFFFKYSCKQSFMCK